MIVKVLIVDDSRIIRNVLKNILSERNIHEDAVLEAPDGRVALDILNAQGVDLLLLDWNMPQLCGLDLIKALRGMERYRALPIIMVTSEAARYNVVEAVKAGVNDYIIKPVTARAILEKVDKYLKRPVS
jgi:two-component system, chemotaxis family, chemotaxis protein CheY